MLIIAMDSAHSDDKANIMKYTKKAKIYFNQSLQKISRDSRQR